MYTLRLSNRIRDSKYILVCYYLFAYPGQTSLMTIACLSVKVKQGLRILLITAPQSLPDKTHVFSLVSDVTFGSNISVSRKVEKYSVNVVCM